MRLTRLELSGFKSFAKPTALEFPSAVTAIVGPNGSGKSNIKEAIQWALGEQSVKTLRGKRGEDLIWNGSAHSLHGGVHDVPRMGRAAVTLTFDNTDGKIPLDFQHVAVCRRIFRDGLNEYCLNDSQVRLKDIVEMMAHAGLGESKHNIIGQGEVDRMLLSSPRERREMLEEALGLKVFQIKKNETLRKLEQTQENMKQVESLGRELAPHLRFLRGQAQKAEQRGVLEQELAIMQHSWLDREGRAIADIEREAATISLPLKELQEETQQKIAIVARDLSDAERELASSMVKTDEEKKLMEFEQKRRELERELGRLEGRLETERKSVSRPKIRMIDMQYIKSEIQEFLSEMRSLLENEDQMEEAREHFWVLVEDLDRLLNKIDRGSTEEVREESEWAIVRSLEQAIKSLQGEIKSIGEGTAHLESARAKERERYREIQQKIKQLDNDLRSQKEIERDILLKLQRQSFEEERIRMRKNSYAIEESAAGMRPENIDQYTGGYAQIAGEELKKRIDRIRIKLEEIGSIDGETFKEYEAMEKRHAFLATELSDLEKAALSLKELMKELDQHIKEDFNAGFEKIKEEFHNFFRIIFGGGKAMLKLVPVSSRVSGDDEIEGEVAMSGAAPFDMGVDISVDLPRKRIHGLAMLSGGERALTSIALLFAITAVNPPPFLILDETDAALDEANSQRYRMIIGELAKKTQLLLITHNRETMKSAGILYGVTMGENGVSKLLSLKLDEAAVYTNR